MQGDQLVPGGKNVFPRGMGLRPPHRRGDFRFNHLKLLDKSARLDVGPHFLLPHIRFVNTLCENERVEMLQRTILGIARIGGPKTSYICSLFS